MRRVLLIALAIWLVAGCSRPPAASSGVPASVLFPPDKTWWAYSLDQESPTTELYIRDANRVISSAATWFLTDRGVWRQNPDGNGLLRYLPPVLQHDLAWKQGDAWFRLRCTNPNDSWELVVLNGSQRTLISFQRGRALGLEWVVDLAQPDQSYRKSAANLPDDLPDTSSTRAGLLAEGARLPEGKLPKVTQVTPAQFVAAMKAQAKKAGQSLIEVDLDNDGKSEWIEGVVDQWTAAPLNIFDDDGTWVGGFANDRFQQAAGHEHRVQVVRWSGADRPTLVQEYHWGPHENTGRETWHLIALRWLAGGHLRDAVKWDPVYTEAAVGSGITLEPDGTALVTANPQDMAGYTWIRRFRTAVEQFGETPSYRAELVNQTLAAGSYPSTPETLLHAAVLARQFGLEGDPERYIPDAAARDTFRFGTPLWHGPDAPQTGTLRWVLWSHASTEVPVAEPGTLGPNGETGFLLRMHQAAGYSYVAGRIAFGTAPDGRLVIRTVSDVRIGVVN